MLVTPVPHTGTHAEDLLRALERAGAIARGDADRVLRAQSQTRGGLVETITGLGILSEDAAATALAEQLCLSRLDPNDGLALDAARVTLRFQELNSIAVCQASRSADAEPMLAMRDPTDEDTREAVRFALKRDPEVVVATPRELLALHRQGQTIERDEPLALAANGDADMDLERLRESASDAPIIKLVNDLIADAVERGASDLHFEPHETRLNVRQRADGILRDVESLPIGQLAPVISRLKIMASLDIGERRLPQDGAISTNVRGRLVDLRVATAPSIRGEAVVVRILNQSRAQLGLEALGLSPHIVEGLREALSRPNGLLLVTGPTGSGKSTTLYAALQLLNDGARKILTIEDPVEFKLDGVTQVQVRPDIGLTFASALRSMLRHDPDVILVGEIRDAETAKIAIQAALTGHLVLASLHTNSAVSAVTRLRDMGVEPFLIASTLIGVLAQRLARRLCGECKAPTENGDWVATGCEQCGETGYAGRIAPAEYFRVSDEARRAISTSSSEDDLTETARSTGWRPLQEEMKAAARIGVTSQQEDARVRATVESRHFI